MQQLFMGFCKPLNLPVIHLKKVANASILIGLQGQTRQRYFLEIRYIILLFIHLSIHSSIHPSGNVCYLLQLFNSMFVKTGFKENVRSPKNSAGFHTWSKKNELNDVQIESPEC
jgi:hypothetical protein